LQQWKQKQEAKLQNITLEDYIDKPIINAITNVILTGQSLPKSKLNFDLSYMDQMEDYLYEIKNILEEFLLMVRAHQTPLNRVSTINLIIALVNVRDIFETLLKNQLTDPGSFTWQIQIKLRFNNLNPSSLKLK
jgi:hypothetical protein